MPAKVRTQNDHFHVLSMCKGLEKYARMKACGWDWELSYYAKTRRSQGPDHAGLLRYVKLIGVMLVFLPNACPLPLQIQEVWLWLQRHYDIMSPSVQIRCYLGHGGGEHHMCSVSPSTLVSIFWNIFLEPRGARTCQQDPRSFGIIGMCFEVIGIAPFVVYASKALIASSPDPQTGKAEL